MTLVNDVKDERWYADGIYTFQGIVNGMDYWTHVERPIPAIWYMEGSTNYWMIGRKDKLGQFAGIWIYGKNPIEKKCPNDGVYPWTWSYSNLTNWIPTTDISVKCLNEDDFCTSENPCEEDKGDCDKHSECQNGLVCGTNNCPDYLGLNSDMDCCYNSTIGDDHFCTTVNPCGLNEGDCDANEECQGGLSCDLTNVCPAYLGFNSNVACCTSTLPATTTSITTTTTIGTTTTVNTTLACMYPYVHLLNA